MGIPSKTAASFVEMYRGINDGIVINEEPRSASNTTPTSFETFVQEVLFRRFAAGPLLRKFAVLIHISQSWMATIASGARPA